ncbi:MAG TPA: hypothetical protein VFO10_27120 [Oligoflexus sp.]|uniref:hypothetical protein n=1 Tax=Oligoflexus sp. TaxID=1971216 RepID=UPI002D7F058D|nr:hypothetical protein [Oligoflexus sp.]HET9240967.1 hypothetical protein [Oligoflexus sp.]
MKMLSGLRNSILTFLALISTQVWAQTPTQCLQENVALEQSAAWLQALTAMPTPPFVPLITRGEARFVNTAALLSEVAPVSPRSIILNDIEELRFISTTLAGTPLVLILKSAPDWTAEKSRKVVAVARTLNISLSLVWLDESQVPALLASTIAEANGRIIRLNELTRAVLEKFCVAS